MGLGKASKLPYCSQILLCTYHKNRISDIGDGDGDGADGDGDGDDDGDGDGGGDGDEDGDGDGDGLITISVMVCTAFTGFIRTSIPSLS